MKKNIFIELYIDIFFPKSEKIYGQKTNMKVIFPNFAHISKTPWKYEISEHLKCSISSYTRSYFQVDPLTFFSNFLNFYLYLCAKTV